MTALDDKMVPKAFQLIAKLGKLVRFVVVSGGAYDPTTQTMTGETTTNVDAKTSPPTRVSEKLIDGDNVRFGDLVIYLPAQGLTFVPKIEHTVVIDSRTYRILEVGPIYSGEQIALYEIRVRE